MRSVGRRGPASKRSWATPLFKSRENNREKNGEGAIEGGRDPRGTVRATSVPLSVPAGPPLDLVGLRLLKIL